VEIENLGPKVTLCKQFGNFENECCIILNNFQSLRSKREMTFNENLGAGRLREITQE
jgi:hypothetical protein